MDFTEPPNVLRVAFAFVSSTVVFVVCANSVFGTPPRPSLSDWSCETEVTSCSASDSLEMRLFAKGVFLAEQDYASGKAAIWDWGSDSLRGPIANIDKGRGLPLRPIGCVRDPFSNFVCATYNWHLRRIVDHRGLPPDAIGVKDRYEKLCAMISARVTLQWTQLKALTPQGDPLEVSIGSYKVMVKKPEKSDKIYGRPSALISKEGKLIGRCPLVFASVEGFVDVALIPELDVIVFNNRPIRYFIDAIHTKVWLAMLPHEE